MGHGKTECPSEIYVSSVYMISLWCLFMIVINFIVYFLFPSSGDPGEMTVRGPGCQARHAGCTFKSTELNTGRIAIIRNIN